MTTAMMKRPRAALARLQRPPQKRCLLGEASASDPGSAAGDDEASD
ncbi:MAG: hypothetical protein CM15mP115_24550 [Alphaproteobacteria bacterium]|nr:MAG: hypothetical protein CM15mP115_24550 [Alphaproteobacteria bacterium]